MLRAMITPLLKKLRFKAGMRVYVSGAPGGYEAELAQLPPEVERAPRLSGKFDLVQAFFTKQAQLERDVPKLARALKPGGIVWLAYPKARALETDLNRDIIREGIAPLGLETVAIAALDETWSALRCKLMG